MQSVSKPASIFAGLGVLLIVLSGLLLASDDASAAPNLVTNGDFPANATGWTAGADTTLTWAAGAAQVDFTGGAPGTAIVESGCITLPGAAATYELVGSSKLAAANNVSTT